MRISPEQIQSEYYGRTASIYDDMHTTGDDAHYEALKLIDMYCERFRLESLLDVGAGTGRGVNFLLSRKRKVYGLEPVRALIEQAECQGLPKSSFIEGTGYALPFKDASFDAVFECGVLHHVRDPSRVIHEMIRVSRRAVFLSDSNRFGQGRTVDRLVKLGLYLCKLWDVAKFIQTRGKMYSISEGDGLAYSYSVFDSYWQLAGWADVIWTVRTDYAQSAKSWLDPLITASHVLLCAFKHGDVPHAKIPIFKPPVSSG